MWAKVGINTRLVTLPRAQYFPKLEKLDTSLYMLGWGGASFDAQFTLSPVLSTFNGKGDGDYNYGRYADPKFDAIVSEVKVEMNADKRIALVRRALEIQRNEIYHLPLHRQVIPWAARTGVELPHRAASDGIEQQDSPAAGVEAQLVVQIVLAAAAGDIDRLAAAAEAVVGVAQANVDAHGACGQQLLPREDRVVGPLRRDAVAVEDHVAAIRRPADVHFGEEVGRRAAVLRR